MTSALISSLERTDEWLKDLGSELYTAREDLRDPNFEDVTTEALGNLEEFAGEFNHYVDTIESAAQELDWSSETKKQDYLEEVQENKRTLQNGLEQAVDARELSRETYEEMNDAIRELRDCTAGLLEDL